MTTITNRRFTLTTILLIAMALTLAFTLNNEALADCDFYGKVAAVDIYQVSSKYAYVYFIPEGGSSYFHLGYLANLESNAILDAAVVSQATQARVFVSTDVSLCPSSGSLRSVGTIKRLFINPS